FGVGFGMAFAQLSNVTLSAVPVREAGEATGVFNTFRQLGATLGNAVLGSILLTTLTTGVINGIGASTAIPDQIKPKILAGATEQAKSLGVDHPQASGAQIPAVVTAEITRIRNQATTDGTRAALGYGATIVAVGVIASIWLPAKGHAPERPAGSPPSAPPGASPAESLPSRSKSAPKPVRL
ncbi:MAG TPA: hypothetical protein VMR98_00480, partial [Candidatus Polarisedimenticolaceae bacterium]|nr:hypothetical protein [Candidatus Polarisedimenticolaceae bacterium]